jgi:Flp pilus assembly protein TadG
MGSVVQNQYGLLRRFLRDKRGVSAIEFAFAAPVMITLYFGIVEISDRLMADRKATTLASTAADLVAQDDEITDSEMADVLNATVSVLLPMNPANATVRITSIVADVDGETTVAWSDALNTSAHSPGATIEVPDGLVSPGGSVIFAETSFTHTSTTGIVIQDSRTVTDQFYLRPRRSETITRID